MNIQYSTQPYPGLRPFKSYESDIFFGRDEHVKQLLKKFGETHFVAVVGPSGYGKSSLVRTGLLASLELGFLEANKTRWRIAETHPGDNPLTGLVNALQDAFEPKIDLQQDPTNVHRHLNKENNENLLVFVDQFEEIFRFYPHCNRADTIAFVADLLKMSQHGNIYVVITMRSEFLGNCSQFYNLPEAINQGVFLVPRLNKQQLQLIIEGPARVFGGTVEPDLVDKLLKDMEGGNSDPTFDQLPLLQHVLMRMWSMAKADKEGVTLLTLDHYQQVGELKGALSKHANEAYDELTKDQQKIAEVLFRSLSEPGGAPDLRRPVKLGEVATLVNQSEAANVTVEKEVKNVVEVFRKEGRDFLLPHPPCELTSDTLLDISHESLLRQWDNANEWIKKETDQVNLYRWLKEDAERWKNGGEGLWNPPNLGRALTWRVQLGGVKGAKEWARRYDTSIKFDEEFQHTMTFLDGSGESHQIELQKKREESQRIDNINQRKKKPTKLWLWGLFLFVSVLFLIVNLALVITPILHQEVLLPFVWLEGIVSGLIIPGLIKFIAHQTKLVSTTDGLKKQTIIPSEEKVS